MAKINHNKKAFQMLADFVLHRTVKMCQVLIAVLLFKFGTDFVVGTLSLMNLFLDPSGHVLFVFLGDETLVILHLSLHMCMYYRSRHPR